jgi:hypothetical protein
MTCSTRSSSQTRSSPGSHGDSNSPVARFATRGWSTEGQREHRDHRHPRHGVVRVEFREGRCDVCERIILCDGETVVLLSRTDRAESLFALSVRTCAPASKYRLRRVYTAKARFLPELDSSAYWNVGPHARGQPIDDQRIDFHKKYKIIPFHGSTRCAHHWGC